MNKEKERRLIAAETLLQKMRNDSSLWKIGRAGGQDRYAGLPPFTRLIDGYFQEQDWLDKTEIDIHVCKNAPENGALVSENICPYCGEKIQK